MNLSLLLVGIGGFLGSILRYQISLLFINSPIATFCINITGCFLIGVINPLLDMYFPYSQSYRLFIITGFLGGFTTFSAFGLDGFTLLKNGYPAEATFYIVIQITTGLFAVYLGGLLVKRLVWSM